MSRVRTERLMDLAMERGDEVPAFVGTFLFISADVLERFEAIADASWRG